MAFIAHAQNGRRGIGMRKARRRLRRVSRAAVCLMCSVAMVISMFATSAIAAFAEEAESAPVASVPAVAAATAPAEETAASGSGETASSQDTEQIAVDEEPAAADPVPYEHINEALPLTNEGIVIPYAATGTYADADETASVPQTFTFASEQLALMVATIAEEATIEPGSALGNAGGTIDKGGTYKVTAATTGLFTIGTSEPVVIEGTGAWLDYSDDEVGPRFAYADGVSADITLRDFLFGSNGNYKHYEEERVPLIKFSEKSTNTMRLEGTNAVYWTPGSSNGRLASVSLFVVNQGSSLTVRGSGSLTVHTSFTGIFASEVGKLNGQMDFGVKGEAGPTISLSCGTNRAIGSPSNPTAGYADGESDDVPGAINFNSGVYNFAGALGIIGAGDSRSPKAAANLRVNIASGAVLNYFLSGKSGVNPDSSTNIPPIGGGTIEQPYNNVTYKPDDPATGGVMTVETGAVVRSYVVPRAATDAYPPGQPFYGGVNYNPICMFIQNGAVASDSSLVGFAFDLGLLGEAALGSYSYCIDEGEMVSYDPVRQGFDSPIDFFRSFSGLISGSGIFNSGDYWNNCALNGTSVTYPVDWPEASQHMPMFLTPENHVITVNGKTFDLYYHADTRTFEVGDTSYDIVYDLNDEDGSKYRAEHENPDTIKASDGVVPLNPAEREGFTFEGWFNADGALVTEVDATLLDDTLYLTAQWSPIMLDVSFPHWEGGRVTQRVQYGKQFKIDDVLVSDELKSAYDVPDLPEDEQPEPGFTTIGYRPYLSEEGDLSLVKASGMPAMCEVTLVQPEQGCRIWGVDLMGNEYEDATFMALNGTALTLLAYPEDGWVFECFTIDGEKLLDDEGRPAYTITVREHMTIAAQVREVTHIKASIPADENMILVNNDADYGERISDGIHYRIIKTGIRYVGGVVEYVKDYPVYDGDPLYEDDVLTCDGFIDDSIIPDDPNMEFIGNIRFGFNAASEDDLIEAVASYRVLSEDSYANTEEGAPTSQTGVLAITHTVPTIAQKTWTHVADASWFDDGVSGVYYLSTPEQLAGMVTLLTTGQHFEGCTLVLENDISLANNDGTTGLRYWESTDGSYYVYAFAGTFDGNGHEITGLLMNGEKPRAAFIQTLHGTVKNLTIEGRIDAADRTYVAGIAGYVYGGTVENCVNRVDITGKGYAGGIAGGVDSASTSLRASIINCRNEATITVGDNGRGGGIVGTVEGFLSVKDCVNVGTITGSQVVGGIAGYTPLNTAASYYILFDNCVNSGDVSVGYSFSQVYSFTVGGILSQGFADFTNCFNTGTLTIGDDDPDHLVRGGTLGGIVGYATDSRITGCGNTGTLVYKGASSDHRWPAHMGGIAGTLVCTNVGSSITGSYSNATIDAGYAGDYDYIAANGTHMNLNADMLAGIGGLVGTARVSGTADKGKLMLSKSYASGSILWVEGACEVDHLDNEYIPGGVIGLCSGDLQYETDPGRFSTGLLLDDCYYLSGFYDPAPVAGAVIDAVSAAVARAIPSARASVPQGVQSVGRTPLETEGGHVSVSGYALSTAALKNEVLSWKADDGEPLFGSDTDLQLNGGMPLLSAQTQSSVDVSVYNSAEALLASFKLPAGLSFSTDEVIDRYLGGDAPAFAGNIAAGYSGYEYSGMTTKKGSMLPQETLMYSISEANALSSVGLYPIYQGIPIVYSITYHLPESAQNSTFNPTSYTVESYAMRLYDPYSTDDEFMGWYATPDLSGSLVNSIGGGQLGDVELYSRWASDDVEAPRTHSITYHLNGGTNAAANPFWFTEGTVVKLASPLRGYYYFDGWYESRDFSGEPITQIGADRASAVELWAKWRAMPTVPPDGEYVDGGSGTIADHPLASAPTQPTTTTTTTSQGGTTAASGAFAYAPLAGTGAYRGTGTFTSAAPGYTSTAGGYGEGGFTTQFDGGAVGGNAASGSRAGASPTSSGSYGAASDMGDGVMAMADGVQRTFAFFVTNLLTGIFAMAAVLFAIVGVVLFAVDRRNRSLSLYGSLD